jgi:hypothetical protein
LGFYKINLPSDNPKRRSTIVILIVIELELELKQLGQPVVHVQQQLLEF